MTVAAKEPFAATRSGAEEVLRGKGGKGFEAPGGSRNPWRRVWQVPLLLAGVGIFGLGVRAVVRTIKPVPFNVQVAGVRTMLGAEQFPKAIEQINLLGKYYREPAQQAELQLLAGDTHFLWQRKQPVPVRENFQRVIEHYQKGVALGASLTPLMEERWGESALAIGDAPTAIAKLEEAVAAEPSLLPAHIRELVSAYAADGVAGGKPGAMSGAPQQLDKAQKLLKQLLASKRGEGEGHGLEAVDNRTWAICKRIEIAIATAGQGDARTLAEVVEEARAAVKEIPERDPSGRILTWIGRAELERGQIDDARRDLGQARAHFIAHHLDDGRAALMLARIAEARGSTGEAAKLYQEVATSQEGTPIWAAARFGRAEMAVREEQEGAAREGEDLSKDGGGGEDDVAPAVQADFRFAIGAVTGGSADFLELISPGAVQAGLLADYQRSSDRGRLNEALTFLELQKELAIAAAHGSGRAGERGGGKGEAAAQTQGSRPAEDAALVYRFATTRERRAEELLAEAGRESGPAQGTKESEARALFAAAAEDYQRHASLTTMQDAVSAGSQWKAAQLFDRAGKPVQSIAAYEKFTIQHPRDPRVAEGLLSIGQLYQSSGLVEKAIPYYQRNMKENPRTPAAYTSAVNLARCYMALQEAAGPEGAAAATAPAATMANRGGERGAAFEKAEAALLSIVQNNSDIQPAANEYRTSLFTLGELYYRNGRWADAILRFEEAVERYPRDEGAPRALFMLGESFRKSAADIAAAMKKDPAIAGREALENARRDRLLEAARLFTRVIGLLDPHGNDAAGGGEPAAGGGGVAPAAAEKNARTLTRLEQEYVRSAYMDRASCYFDREEYAAAIKLYDQTATRFADEVIGVKAYVQIVNAYLALREPTQASAAAERGLWILKRVPDEAFAEGPVKVSRDYYQKLLTLEKQ
jgi:tetratricopeptide (TPR) repeat protein